VSAPASRLGAPWGGRCVPRHQCGASERDGAAAAGGRRARRRIARCRLQPARPRAPPPRPLRRLAGDFGFDPLGLGKEPTSLKWYQQAELVHGRTAMTAVAGILFPSVSGRGLGGARGRAGDHTQITAPGRRRPRQALHLAPPQAGGGRQPLGSSVQGRRGRLLRGVRAGNASRSPPRAFFQHAAPHGRAPRLAGADQGRHPQRARVVRCRQGVQRDQRHPLRCVQLPCKASAAGWPLGRRPHSQQRPQPQQLAPVPSPPSPPPGLASAGALLAVQLFLTAFVEGKRWMDFRKPGSQVGSQQQRCPAHASRLAVARPPGALCQAHLCQAASARRPPPHPGSRVHPSPTAAAARAALQQLAPDGREPECGPAGRGG
jgi:hypothetical protein